MSGGGIGVDWSVYRSSGQLPEANRGQGKRSAAGHGTGERHRSVRLCRQRFEAVSYLRQFALAARRREDFLRMKNWYDMPAGDTTIGHLKEATSTSAHRWIT